MISEKDIQDLFNEYYNLLCNYAAKYVDCPEDVVQEIFTSILYRKNQEFSMQNPKMYLLGAVHRKCQETRRNQRLKMTPLHADDVENVVSEPFFSITEEEADNLVLKELIYRSIRQLSPKCQHIFVLAKIEGKSHKEISEKIGISIKTVENHMNRAYKELRELLKNKLQ